MRYSTKLKKTKLNNKLLYKHFWNTAWCNTISVKQNTRQAALTIFLLFYFMWRTRRKECKYKKVKRERMKPFFKTTKLNMFQKFTLRTHQFRVLPTLSFRKCHNKLQLDHLTGWKVECECGAHLNLNVSHFSCGSDDGPAHQCWEDVFWEVGSGIATLDKLNDWEGERQKQNRTDFLTS